MFSCLYLLLSSISILYYYHQHRFIIRFPIELDFPFITIPLSGVLMKSIGATFLRPDGLPDVNHMRGLQYQIVLNIIFLPEIN